MTERTLALAEYHEELLELMTNRHQPVFHVWDLEDPMAFELALAMEVTTSGLIEVEVRKNLEMRKEAILATGAFAALTVVTSVESANRIRSILSNGAAEPISETPSDGDFDRIMMIVSEGRCLVCIKHPST